MPHCLLRHSHRNGILLALALLIAWVNTQWSIPADIPGNAIINAGQPETIPGHSAAMPGNASTIPGHSACTPCHASIVESHLHTAHWLSSAPASQTTIRGSFKRGRNRFVYNDKMEVLLEKKNGVFLQSAYFNGSLFEAEAFDIVIGFRKGQTYLYWDNNRLYQLPISYYTPADAWCNSPGYPTNIVYFNKQVPGQCMECHATSAELYTDDTGAVTYDKNSLVLGIDCQRCHGDATEHIAWFQAHPADTTRTRNPATIANPGQPRTPQSNSGQPTFGQSNAGQPNSSAYVLNAAHLSRQQRLDACALCHSGFRKQFTPSFSFKVGDTLDKFSSPVYDSSAAGNLDVHGNQYGLLTSSKCFIRSNLDCSSCHNVHADEAGKLQLFSQRCRNCHNPMPPHPGRDTATLATNCIDCHMPALPSNKILLQINGNASPVHDLVRTHRIAIYPQAQ